MSKIDGKYLSYILRHHPEEAGVTLDKYGYADVTQLCAGLKITPQELEKMVNDNTRYLYNSDKTKVKASHGHSVPVEYENVEEPPEFLYHGTADRFYPSIKEQGLLPMNRAEVHLSENCLSAELIGVRHAGGATSHVVLLQVQAKQMYRDGYTFHKSEDNVWLVKEVPPKYLCRVLLGEINGNQ